MRLLLIALLCIFTSRTSVAQEQPPHELTQAGMNQAAGEQLRSAEVEMKALFDALVERAGSNGEALARLRASQVAWEAYREAQMMTLWPFPETGSYGSAQPMCAAYAREAMTQQRIVELRFMLRHEEGNVCASQWPD